MERIGELESAIKALMGGYAGAAVMSGTDGKIAVTLIDAATGRPTIVEFPAPLTDRANILRLLAHLAVDELERAQNAKEGS